MRWLVIIGAFALGVWSLYEGVTIHSTNSKLDKNGLKAMVLGVNNVSVNKSRRSSSTLADIHFMDKNNIKHTVREELSNKMIDKFNNRQAVEVEYLQTNPEIIRFVDDHKSAWWRFLFGLVCIAGAYVIFNEKEDLG